MERPRIPAMFEAAALAVLWVLAALNEFQPVMTGLAVTLSLEVWLFAPMDRRACEARLRRHALRRSVAEGKAWWS